MLAHKSEPQSWQHAHPQRDVAAAAAQRVARFTSGAEDGREMGRRATGGPDSPTASTLSNLFWEDQMDAGSGEIEAARDGKATAAHVQRRVLTLPGVLCVLCRGAG